MRQLFFLLLFFTIVSIPVYAQDNRPFEENFLRIGYFNIPLLDNNSSLEFQLSEKNGSLNLPDVVEKEHSDRKPPLRGGRVASELLIGTIGGFLGFLGGGIIGLFAGISCEDEGYGSCEITDDFSIYTFLIGTSLGSMGGVYLIGSKGNETGSPWATLGGSILGVLGGLGLIAIVSVLNDGEWTNAAAWGTAFGLCVLSSI